MFHMPPEPIVKAELKRSNSTLPTVLKPNGKLLTDEQVKEIDEKKLDLNKRHKKTPSHPFGLVVTDNHIYAIYNEPKDGESKKRKQCVFGKGATAHIKFAQEIHSGEWCALKTIQKSSHISIAGSEFKILSPLNQVHSPLIVRLSKKGENKTNFLINVAPGQSSNEFIVNNPKMPKAIRVYLVLKLFEELANLHKKNILHRDIKPENLMISALLNVTLIDFGFGVQLSSESSYNDDQIKGTLEFLTPLQKKQSDEDEDVTYSKSTDIFAAVGTALEIMSWDPKQLFDSSKSLAVNIKLAQGYSFALRETFKEILVAQGKSTKHTAESLALLVRKIWFQFSKNERQSVANYIKNAAEEKVNQEKALKTAIGYEEKSGSLLSQPIIETDAYITEETDAHVPEIKPSSFAKKLFVNQFYNLTYSENKDKILTKNDILLKMAAYSLLFALSAALTVALFFLIPFTLPAAFIIFSPLLIGTMTVGRAAFQLHQKGYKHETSWNLPTGVVSLMLMASAWVQDMFANSIRAYRSYKKSKEDSLALDDTIKSKSAYAGAIATTLCVVGGLIFCALVFNPFTGLGTLGLVTAIVATVAAVTLVTKVCEFFGRLRGMSETKKLLPQFDDAASDTLGIFKRLNLNSSCQIVLNTALDMLKPRKYNGRCFAKALFETSPDNLTDLMDQPIVLQEGNKRTI